MRLFNRWQASAAWLFTPGGRESTHLLPSYDGSEEPFHPGEQLLIRALLKTCPLTDSVLVP